MNANLTPTQYRVHNLVANMPNRTAAFIAGTVALDMDATNAALADLIHLGLVTRRTPEDGAPSTYYLAEPEAAMVNVPAADLVDAATAQRRELAAVIAGQAQAIADGTVAVESAAVARLLDNVQTLRAWTPKV